MVTVIVANEDDCMAMFPDDMSKPDGLWGYLQANLAEPTAVGIKNTCFVRDGIVIRSADVG